jgi:hypothetical protein
LNASTQRIGNCVSASEGTPFFFSFCLLVFFLSFLVLSHSLSRLVWGGYSEGWDHLTSTSQLCTDGTVQYLVEGLLVPLPIFQKSTFLPVSKPPNNNTTHTLSLPYPCPPLLHIERSRPEAGIISTDIWEMGLVYQSLIERFV